MGRARRRVGAETLRLLTTGGALGLGVLAIFGGAALRRAVGTGAVVLMLLAFGVLLVGGKLLLDRALLGPRTSRRAEDTAALAGLLESLPVGWYVFPDFFLAGTAVEFLVLGPGGLFAVEVYRWLTRDTGTAFPEKVAADLGGRTVELERALGRLTGAVDAFPVQPVFCVLEGEGLRVGDIVVHPSAPDLRHVRGVLLATPADLGALLRAGGPRNGVRTRALSPDVAARLARLLSGKRLGGQQPSE